MADGVALLVLTTWNGKRAYVNAREIAAIEPADSTPRLDLPVGFEIRGTTITLIAGRTIVVQEDADTVCEWMRRLLGRLDGETGEPLGWVTGVTPGRRLDPSAHIALLTEPPVGDALAVWWIGHPLPGNPVAYAAAFNSGFGWILDTVDLDGSGDAADRRMHDWMSGDIQALTVALIPTART